MLKCIKRLNTTCTCFDVIQINQSLIVTAEHILKILDGLWQEAFKIAILITFC